MVDHISKGIAPGHDVLELLTPVLWDRAAGVLLGLACGDALRAGGDTPGEWSAITELPVAVATIAATGAESASLVTLADRIRATPGSLPAAAAGIALAHLDNPSAMATTVQALCRIAGDGVMTADACLLWCSAIQNAVLDGDLHGWQGGLQVLPERRRDLWTGWLGAAASGLPLPLIAREPAVASLLSAWSAMTRTPGVTTSPSAGTFGCQHLQHALVSAATDTTGTAAVTAGALLGARWGASAVPARWQLTLSGPTGLRASDLVRLAILAAWHGRPDATGWPAASHHPPEPGVKPAVVRHPLDPDLLLGNLALAADDSPVELGVDAVVSLCRVGTADFAQCAEAAARLQVWLVDWPGGNAHPHFVVDQAALAIAAFRAEGKKVLMHCSAGRSRTPMVAARYSTLAFGVPPAEAVAGLREALGPVGMRINPELRTVLYELAGEDVPPVDSVEAALWSDDHELEHPGQGIARRTFPEVI
jgi:hypothetical protein